ncbi:sensor histidine kinase [Actinacidiphila sp. bgisy167]|uniref:sensor histidine kinase n=1 Tax=Actinacidiphila sp. bgisy167 TaxID=3413797 RepID=UPI003D764868
MTPDRAPAAAAARAASGSGEDGNARNRAVGLLGRLVRGVGWLAALTALVVLGTLDVTMEVDRLPVVVVALAVAVIMPKMEAQALGAFAAVLGAGLVLLVLVAPPDAYNLLPFGFTPTAVGTVLVGLVAWRAEPVRAALAVPLLSAGLLLQPARLDYRKEALVLALVVALGCVIAAASGLSLRLFQTDRQRQVLAAQQAQRTAIASDLHDYVAHHVTGMVVLAQAARAVAASKPQAVLPALERIEAAGEEAMTAIRRMVTLLREPDAHVRFAPTGTIADIASLAGHFTSDSGLEVRLSIEGEVDTVPIDVQSAVHRVVMEALTNVRKHAGDARSLDILVRREDRPDVVTVEVSDDGPRRDGRDRGREGRAPDGGYGLKGLRERAAALGGSFSAGPNSPKGWTVRAHIPTGGAR